MVHYCSRRSASFPREDPNRNAASGRLEAHHPRASSEIGLNATCAPASIRLIPRPDDSCDAPSFSDPRHLIDAIEYGRELIPLTRKLISTRQLAQGEAAE